MSLEFIRALVNYEATNAKGLRCFFGEAVNDYLEMCEERNINPETPFKGSLNVRLGSNSHRRVTI